MSRFLPYLSILLIVSITFIGSRLWLMNYGYNATSSLVYKPIENLHGPNDQPADTYTNGYLWPLNDGEITTGCIEGCNGDESDMSTQPCDDSSDMNIPSSKYQGTAFHISSPPQENYFYSDCHVATHVVITSPLPDSDHAIVAPRIVIAWPAGNSGACALFETVNGGNDGIEIKIVNSTIGSPLAPVYIPRDGPPSVGVKGVIKFSSTAVLSLAILGSIRAIRDYTEGGRILHPELQGKIRVEGFGVNGVRVSRLWLDNVTTTSLTFIPGPSSVIRIKDGKAIFGRGEYLLSAYMNYPQLKQLPPHEVLQENSLIRIQQLESKALSFLSYSEKLVAGSWRFLTYFGRDDMISTLILLPVLTKAAAEAVIRSVLERISQTDGSVCHEEVIGDYATFLNLKDNIDSNDYRCDYGMVDTDYFLPILVHAHFVEFAADHERLDALLSQPANQINSNSKAMNLGALFIILARKIMRETAPFASPGGQTRENLIHLREGHVTGVWRDSFNGLGSGRIPFDVNTALVPAALRSIASLARTFGSRVFGEEAENWSILADEYAQKWEDSTLQFFEVVIPANTARARLENFVKTSSFYNGPAHSEVIDTDVSYHALALQSDNDNEMVPVMNTDTSFRMFFLNGTNQVQLSNFLNATALSILRPFPAGLMTPVGVVIANPALLESEIIKDKFTNLDYHGTVVWSWQLVMMARGLEKQLDRCNSNQKPGFCSETVVFKNVKNAYNALWDTIEANKYSLMDEVWSWTYKDGSFTKTALGSISAVESDAIQLWSLTFLAVARNEEMR